MSLKKEFVFNSLIGFVIGMLVGIATWVFNSGNDPDRSMILHIVLSGVHGLVPCGAATVFGIESWGLTKCTAVHALITLATILAIEIPLKWWSSAGQFAVALVIYVVIYAIIWIVNYRYWKRTIRELNEQLKSFGKEQRLI